MAQSNDGVYVFDSNSRGGVDPALMLAMNGGFNGMNNPLWMMFMWPMLYPMMSMFGGYGGFGNWGAGGANGAGYIANQLNNDTGRELIVQAINGRADALAQLSQITGQNVSDVRTAISILNSKFSEFGGQLGMSGLQVISELKGGNAALAQQLAQCCCENRLAAANQTAALQSKLAENDANVRLQLAQLDGSDKLSICQQTNQLGSQADRNTNSILNAINAQTVAMNDKFCELKERELQTKIDTQGDLITQLRGQISNDKQTEQFTAAFNALNDKINSIASKQPNTVPVVYPNIQAVNNTPYYNPWGYGQSYWG